MNYKMLLPTYRARYLAIAQILPTLHRNDKACRILNVGSGEGELDGLLTRYARSVHSCDVHRGDLQTARRLNDDHPQVHYAQASGLHLPYRAASFETIVCSEVIEHVPGPEALIAEIARVLSPGGHLLLTCPNDRFPAVYDPINWTLRRWQRPLPLGAYGYGHTWLPRREDLERWAAQNDLRVVSTLYLSRYATGLLELYLPGLLQRALKANADNRKSFDSRRAALRPTARTPLLTHAVDWFIRTEERAFSWAPTSIGLGLLLEKPRVVRSEKSVPASPP